MNSDNCLFELYNSLITDAGAVGNTVILKCLYMKFEHVTVTFDDVRKTKHFGNLKGSTINYMEKTEEGYRVHFIDEKTEPAIIVAQDFKLEWH